jgi:hypothetical protein
MAIEQWFAKSKAANRGDAASTGRPGLIIELL